MKHRKTQKIILTVEQMQQEIIKSHERSARYGVSRQKRSTSQKSLSPEELEQRIADSSDFLKVVSDHIDECYTLLSRTDFMIAFADCDGYILLVDGGNSIQEMLAERNCSVGYRWTEKDVGTTAISLCRKLEVSIQLNDDDHYCYTAQNFTSSAAPIFGPQGVLAGVLVASGPNVMSHAHTLVMVTMTASSIEKQLRLSRRNHEMSVYAGFLDNVLEATDTGLLTFNQDMCIRGVNKKGKKILGSKDLNGRQVNSLGGFNLDLEKLKKSPDLRWEKEAQLANGAHVYYSAQPVFSKGKELVGGVILFEEFKAIKQLANTISGVKPVFTFTNMIGATQSFQKAIDLAKIAAQSASTVLLLGETGTGKELFAQAIHNEGKRRKQPFIPINCGAIPGELLESELFGHVEGAFTGASQRGRPGKFELADKGTILLDEIGDMPHDMQVKLLRVLQTGEVQRLGSHKVVQTDTRIIAATHVDLQEKILENQFRQDLFYRLNIIQITIPPLRERGAEDIIALAKYFICRYGSDHQLCSTAVEVLVGHTWPGNVRELENCVQRALHLCNGGKIKREHLALQQAHDARETMKLGTLKEIERDAIGQTLLQNNFNMAASAKKLSISRATLYRKVKEYDLGAT